MPATHSVQSGVAEKEEKERKGMKNKEREG